HLRTGVVDVVLPHGVRTAGQQQAHDRVAQRRPARVGDVQRPGRVRRDELDVHRYAGLRIVGPVCLTRVDDRLGESTGGCGIQADVDESGPCDLDPGDAVDCSQSVGDL